MRRTQLGVLAATLATALALLVFPRSARADNDLSSVPDVAGKSAEDAKTALVASGFLVGTYEVDGVPVGSVAAQSPAGGVLRPRGSIVTLDVRVHAEGATPAPNAVGQSTAQASTAYGASYDVVFQSVPGEAANRGKVVAQDPAAGAPLALRGRLTLSFVPDPAMGATVPVPSAVGVSPADAIGAVAAAGLHARVVKVTLPGTPADLVVGQTPLPGTETARYSTVDLVVTAAAPGDAPAPPAGPAVPVTVPNVVGTTESAARLALDTAGLDTDVEWVDGDPTQVFLVQSQDPAPGTQAAADSTVKLRVVKSGSSPTPLVPAVPGTPPAKVPMPDLLNLYQTQAEELLNSVGLVPNPIFVMNPSAPALRVFAQQIVPGAPVDAGTLVAFRVAQPPPPSAPVPVPDFYGRSKGEALSVGAQAGLAVTIVEIVTPSHPPHRVYSQSLAAYVSVPLGSTVTLRLARPTAGPAVVAVPDLSGKSKGEALMLLAGIGLSGVATDVVTASHPPYQVYSQFPPAPTPVPSGTSVYFKVAVPPFGWQAVPVVVGLPKAAAVLAVQNAGFVPVVDFLFAPGKPAGIVFDESPAGGELRAPGTAVHLRVPKFITVIVPDVVGKHGANATTILESAGLTVLVKNGIGPKPPGVVYNQTPPAGIQVAPGTVVVIYVASGPGPSTVVPVVVGMMKANALAALNGASLGSDLDVQETFAKPPGTVLSQWPIGGSVVPGGSVVHLKIAKSPVGPSLVQVPNLFGMTEAQATVALATKNLVGDFKHLQVLGHPFGKVYDQAPNAFLWASAGSTVVVRIAEAVVNGQAIVPNLIGKTPLQAGFTLGQASLGSSGSQVINFLAPHGKVWWQDKPAGSIVGPGTVVVWRWNP